MIAELLPGQRARRIAVAGLALGVLTLGAGGQRASAQSITDGSLVGMVVDTAGGPMIDVRVVVTDGQTGVSQEMVTGFGGRFTVHMLQPGTYDLLVEKLGYQPIRYTDLPIRPGAVLDLRATLVVAEMPVAQVDTLTARRATTAEASRAGVGLWVSDFGLTGAPGEDRTIANVGRYAGFSTGDLESEGLTRWLSGLTVDGVQYRGNRVPDVAYETAGLPGLPLSAFANSELVTNGVDVEWSGFAGSTLSAFSRRGSSDLRLSLFGDWSGAPVAGSKYFDPQDLQYSSWRGGAMLSGPIVRDTAHFVIGAEAMLTEQPYPRAWTDASLDDSLLTVADSLGVDLTAYTRPRLVTTKSASVFTRFDWQIRNHSFRLRASAGGLRESDTDLAPTDIASIGSQYKGIDGQVALGLTSVFSPSFMTEMRVGFEGGNREYQPANFSGTSLTDAGIAVGTDARLPAESKYSAVRGNLTFHFPFGLSHLKAGVGGWWSRSDQTYANSSEGQFAFGGISQLAQGDGTFVQTVGAFPVATFNTWQFDAYVQGQWYAAPGLTLTGGFRYQLERTPIRDVQLNSDWLERTGIPNNGITLDSLGLPVAAENKFSRTYPRFGFTWEIGANHEWVIRGGAGLYRNELDPPIMAEILTYDGDVLARRGLGAVGAWPSVPDSAAAPVQGQLLSMLGPEWETPRTARFSLGLTRSLDARSSFHLAGAYRHTDFLTRRHDINRVTSPRTRDQYGRSIWGTLEQRGSQIAAVPGSNRRFTGFDVVSSLDADGFSDYWAVTVGLERQISRGWRAWAQYTGSVTRDNWLGATGGPDLGLSPFPDSLSGVEWEDGISDFDRPDRVVVATEIQFGNFPVAIAGFYRFESGLPFTPGFRSGVDANGDGSLRNDVAYVDTEVDGISELVGKWDCLRSQVNRFADRNTCRLAPTHNLDLRLSIRLFQRTKFPTEIVIDGVNLIEPDIGVPDNALYLIDPTGSLTTAPDGTVNVPLVANPNFGELLVRRTTGRFVRAGFRINY